MRVAVTRPEPENAVTAERLQAAGHEPISIPLTETIALHAAHFDSVEADAVAVTSANALRHADAALLGRLAHLALFTVGDRTGSAARQRGFGTVRSAGGDVEDLLTLALAETPDGATILYLCGRPRRPDFEHGILKSGRRVQAVETYETRSLVLGPDTANKLAGTDAILVSAQSAAEILARIDPELPQTTLICMSARIAACFKGMRHRIIVAEQPNETAMFAALGRV